MVHLVRGESGDARPSGSPNPSSFRLVLEETGMGFVTWPFPTPGWQGGVSPSSPGTGGRGASSRKLLLGSGRRVTNTVLLLMVSEFFSLSLRFFFSSSSSSQQSAWSLLLSQVSRGSSEPPFWKEKEGGEVGREKGIDLIKTRSTQHQSKKVNRLFNSSNSNQATQLSARCSSKVSDAFSKEKSELPERLQGGEVGGGAEGRVS